MPVAASTSVPREASWLRDRLKALSPPLPVFRDAGRGTGRCIVYSRQGGTDIQNLYDTFAVRSAWLVYVSQPVGSSSLYVEDLQADADRIHEAIQKPQGVQSVSGRYVLDCRRDSEHYLPVYDGITLTEMQLGGIYVLRTSLSV